MEQADGGELERSSLANTGGTVAKEGVSSAVVRVGEEGPSSALFQHAALLTSDSSAKPLSNSGPPTSSATKAGTSAENIPTGPQGRKFMESLATTSTTPLSAAVEAPISPRHSAEEGMSFARKNITSSPPSAKANRKRGVPHVYRDYSNVPDTAGYVRKKTGGVTQPFPEKLHELLERENEPAVISWLPHGRAFLVRKPKEFTNYVMPKYFRQTKLTSFQRQLNLYGFRRITQGPDGGAYYHELFLRGRPQLCMRMQRQKVKGTGHKQPADAQTEPNFYSMPSSQAQPLDTSPPIAPPVAAQRSYEDISPGLEGVHGAAELLKNIAAGLPGSSVTFSLGASAVSQKVGKSSLPGQPPTITPAHRSPTSAAPPKKATAPQHRPLPTLLPSPPGGAQSMSLLGRIAHTGTGASPSSSPPRAAPLQQPAFFWPPVRQPAVPSLPILKQSPHSSIVDASAAEGKLQPSTKDPKETKPDSDEQQAIPIALKKESIPTQDNSLPKETPLPPKSKETSPTNSESPQEDKVVVTKSEAPADQPAPHPIPPPTTPAATTDQSAIAPAILNGIQTEEV